jgi:hypothetical protein
MSELLDFTSRSVKKTSTTLAFLLSSALAAGATRITPLHPETVEQAIVEAHRAGEHRVVIPPGTYRLSPHGRPVHLEFQDISDLTIDAVGVQFLFTDQTSGGIAFRDCRNVRFSGATIRYQTPPFTQAVVESTDRGGASYVVRIEKGYPTNLDDPRYFPTQPIGYLFDPQTRWWKPGAYDLYGTGIKRLGPDRFRVDWNRSQPAASGDLVAFRGSGPHNITLVNCTRMQLTGLTIYNAGAFALLESQGDGDNRYTVAVKRGPRPSGASTDPLLSSTADAFHSVEMRRGPTLEHCEFESMGDDGIAIHGIYSFVFEARGNRLVVNHNSFRRGDPLRLLDPQGRPVSEAVVESVRPLDNFTNARKSRRTTLSDNTAGPFFEITLDRPLAADFDYLASNPAANGSGYVLRGNTIRNHRARGMLLKADRGLIEDNTIDGSTMGGIVLTPEFWWNEASYSRNVTIRHNTIRHTAYAPDQLGGVVIAAIDSAPLSGYGHQHIVLENNRFENINGVNLLITSATDVLVKENVFIHAQHARTSVAGASWGEYAGALIFVTEADPVRFENNVAEDLGPFQQDLIHTTPSGRIEGAGPGIRIGK